MLNNPKVHVIDYDGRLYLAHTTDRYDVIDLSLADSAGLSSPGGFAIVEKYSYTREAMTSYMRALKDGGILSVTLWNKEEPPKSVLKLYATMAAAAREVDDGDIAKRFFVVSSYLSTATVLYKRGGFHAEEIAKLRDAHARHVVRRDLLSRLRIRRIADRQGAGGLPATRSSPKAARNPTAMEEPTPDGDAAGGGAARRSRTCKRRRGGAGDGDGPAGLAPSRPRRLGGRRRPLRVRHPRPSPTTGRTSPPT